jgi:lipopolysaccharide transport system ATP-binding protein
MSDFAIKVEGLSKRYKIGKLQRRHDTLRDRIADARVFNLFKRRNGNHNSQSELSSSNSQSEIRNSQSEDIIWALKDVSFEVKPGEVVGIIGRNGAGKSTLLKILSRITDPTEGFADIHGRVGSLLEVGTGFHPELTGRENIYLNGAILGMKRTEIISKFDEIVSFAELEKFVDMPVKRYSSGMYLRLAFAVAAHLEPETLMVDEVLAVGDAAFQKKCLGKLEDVSKEGRTVLFVSHNLAAVAKLCQRGIVLDHGSLLKDGSASEAIFNYTQLLQVNDDERPVGREIEVTGLEVVGGQEAVDTSKETKIRFLLHLNKDLWRIKLLLVIRNADQVLIVRNMLDSTKFPELRALGKHEFQVSLPPLWLSSGHYTCYIKIMADALGELKRYLSDPLVITVTMYDYEDRQPQGSEVLAPACDWKVRQAGSEVYNSE